MGCFMSIYNPTTNNKVELYRSAFKMAELLQINDMGWHEIKKNKIKKVYECLKGDINRNEVENFILSKIDLIINEQNTEDIYDIYFDY